MNTSFSCCSFVAMLLASAVASSSAAPAPMPAQQPTHQPAAAAKPVAVESVSVQGAWVRAAPPGAMMLAGYMTLRNAGKDPVRFEWAQSDAFGMVELHRSMTVNGMATMRPAGAQTIPAGGELKLEPGGLHLMLMDAKRALKIGDSVRFRLHFAGGGFLDVSAPIAAQAPAAR